jgi:carnitine O-acetyltransferase
VTATAISPRTFGSEDSLPRVPLPTPEDSCARFLDWCAPLLTADEFAATETAVAEFLAPDSPAHTLHAALEEFDRGGAHSWLDVFWPYRYLGRRDRIALNANFFFLFRGSGRSQVERAAGLITGALHVKRLVDREELPVATLRGAPLSMEQNKYLFSATRIPGAEIDSVRTPYSDEHPGPSPERHVLVFRRGRIFRLDVLGPTGDPHTLDELTAALQAIVARATPAEPGTSVGHLTTKARAEWAASRARLLELGNAEALEAVESALFCVSLDDVAPADARAASDQLLHGDSANRWFDKAVTLVVFADGTAGFNGEHCKLDGTTVVSFVDFLLTAADDEHAAGAGARPQGVPQPDEIVFVLDDDLRADVGAAGAAFADHAADTATMTLSIEGFTQADAKALRCSPDAFAQLAFQLAHRRATGLTGATYESIATRHYHHGRTEAMRVVTPEVLAFVDAMDDPAADADIRRAAFRAAAAAHVARARQCQAGQAPEQHLWELQLIQRRRGAELGVTEPLALYDSPGWTIMREDYLSTSAVPSPNVRFFGFGSTSARCIGVGYALMSTRFDIYLSTPRSVAEQMHTFAVRLQEAVTQLSELLRTEIPA